MEGGKFDYREFLKKRGVGYEERPFSHGTIRLATITFLTGKGKHADAFKLHALDNMYKKRRTADYEDRKLHEIDLKDSLRDLNTILSVVV